MMDRKYAILNLFRKIFEKPLRSDLSHAKLTQSPAQSSHTEFRYAHSSGFSLAEAMVMLVVISILLAVSAPLIARKANADQRRLVVPGNPASNVVTAMGNGQNFGIGVSTPNAKLHVNDGSNNPNHPIARFVTTIAGNYDAGGRVAHSIPIFEVTPDNRAQNPNGFRVFADGTTNIRTCVPDWSNTTNYAFNAAVSDDGYVIASECVSLTSNNLLQDGGNNINFCPPINITGIQGIPDAGGTLTSPRINILREYMGYVIVPVKSGDSVNADLGPNAGNVGNITNHYNSNYFIPCVQDNR